MVFFRDRRLKDLLDRIGDRELSRVGAQLLEKCVPALSWRRYHALK